MHHITIYVINKCNGSKVKFGKYLLK